MTPAKARTAKRFTAAGVVLLVWCAAFVIANHEAAPAPVKVAETTEPGAATPAKRTQHPAVSEDDKYYAEVMIYKGNGHESWVGVLPGDKPVPLTETPGFDAHEFEGLFEGACDPSQIDPRYTNAKYLSKQCREKRPGQELIHREQAEAMLGG